MPKNPGAFLKLINQRLNVGPVVRHHARQLDGIDKPTRDGSAQQVPLVLCKIVSVYHFVSLSLL